MTKTAAKSATRSGRNAQARAKLVRDFFVTSGFDPKRLELGHPQATQSSMGYVPLPFTLTVFEK